MGSCRRDLTTYGVWNHSQADIKFKIQDIVFSIMCLFLPPPPLPLQTLSFLRMTADFIASAPEENHSVDLHQPSRSSAADSPSLYLSCVISPSVKLEQSFFSLGTSKHV
jgi:hypothetical protein